MILGSLRNNADEDFVAVYDGHGGGAVSAYVAKHLHKVPFPTPSQTFSSFWLRAWMQRKIP